MSSSEAPGCNCTIYRPWFSPYSYLVCTARASLREACGCPDMPAASARDPGQATELPDITCSSCSLEWAGPSLGSRRASASTEAWACITAHDILLASRWQPALQNGYKCLACCRIFPTLHSLKTHVACGSKEGFSCQVYYQRLKALWKREGAAWTSCKTPK